jgi:hypothetical protein
MRNVTATAAARTSGIEISKRCEQCDQPFEPRARSGGSPQRFCSTDCRLAFHNNAQRGQRSPAYSAPVQPKRQRTRQRIRQTILIGAPTTARSSCGSSPRRRSISTVRTRWSFVSTDRRTMTRSSSSQHQALPIFSTSSPTSAVSRAWGRRNEQKQQIR